MERKAEEELQSFYKVIAPYYDDDYATILGGQEFYTALAKESGGPVLEMGCGTGRILLPIARAGMDCYGIDISQPMLDRFHDQLCSEPAEVRNRVQLIQGDFRTADVGRTFPFVFAAGNVLHTFIDHEDQRAWLRNVRRHLAPGGAFVFDVFQFDFRYLLMPSDEWHVQVDRTDDATGTRTRRLYRIDQEPEFQRFRVDMRWVVDDRKGSTIAEEQASIMQRWFTRGELELLLEIEGFRITDYWGSFERHPFGRGSPEQIIRAVAAAE